MECKSGLAEVEVKLEKRVPKIEEVGESQC